MSPLADIQQDTFGTLPDGTPVHSFTLRNGDLELSAITLGATITSLRTPDRHGEAGDVVIGFDSLAEYLEDRAYIGALVGRCANRIAQARFALGDTLWQLPANDGPHHLHGGPAGFHRRIWRAAPWRHGEEVGLEFTRLSPAGEEGYPGNLQVRVRYVIEPGARVRLEYHAVSDDTTPVNLTQHSYFNLGGGAAPDIRAHRLRLRATHYLPVDGELIPTGEVASVQGSPFDFLSPAELGARLSSDHPQLLAAGGFDHTFLLDHGGSELEPAVVLHDPDSGRTLEVRTTSPGVQLYTGNFLDGSLTARGRCLARHSALCLETQHPPNAVNIPGFPSVLLQPGQVYHGRTTWTFRCLELA